MALQLKHKVMRIILLFLLIFSTQGLQAQLRTHWVHSDSINTKLLLDLPLVSLPYGLYASAITEGAVVDVYGEPAGYTLRAWTSPSMKQSLAFSHDTRYAIFYGTSKLFNVQANDKPGKKLWKTGAESVLNLAADLLLPFGFGWQHEEYHRAVLTSHNIYSNNSLNDWISGRENVNGSSTTSVNYVLDTNLVSLKKRANSDLVRLMTAGVEGEVLSAQRMQRDNFFHTTNYANSLNILGRFISVELYIRLCSNRDEIQPLVDDAIEGEAGDQSIRDFTGPDFTAWAYDLFNPDLPYAARGEHPYGNGYDRYVYGDKLNQEQYEWIKKQSNLSLLNFISPMNFFINSFELKTSPGGNPLLFNFAFSYYPTSFGSQVGLNLLLKNGDFNWIIAPTINKNYEHNFPSLEVALWEYPLGDKTLFSPRLMLWTQPKDQSFYTQQAEVGGLVAGKVSYKLGSFHPYIDMAYKTKGWVAGEAFLENRFSMDLGIMARW